MSLKTVMQTKFNPTLSFDGVAMITACATCCFWFGGLDHRVKQNTDLLKKHDKNIETLSDSVMKNAQTTAVLQQIVQDKFTK